MKILVLWLVQLHSSVLTNCSIRWQNILLHSVCVGKSATKKKKTIFAIALSVHIYVRVLSISDLLKMTCFSFNKIHKPPKWHCYYLKESKYCCPKWKNILKNQKIDIRSLTDRTKLHIPKTHRSAGGKASSVFGPRLWNLLPTDITAVSLTVFKKLLKTYLFSHNIKFLFLIFVFCALFPA